MKAFLLAAGLGTRLRPLTDTVPKCLVPIGGEPLLSYWLRLFAKHGVDEVLMNTHYLHEQVEAYIAEHNREGKQPHVTLAYEPTLLGSGGTVRANRGFVAGEEGFFICYADNLTNIDLTALRTFAAEKDSLAAIALFHAPQPKECGIVALDGEGRIVSFEEKPQEPQSDLANGGVYFVRQDIFNDIPATEFSDFGKDVLPKLVGRMHGFPLSDYLLDIGTPEKYSQAQTDVKTLSP